MILYHGTSESAAKKILLSGYLSTNEPSNWDNPLGNEHIHLKTEKGFVYFSNKFSRACYSGIHNNNKYNDEENFYIFKCTIPNELLLPDLDELYISFKNIFAQLDDNEKNVDKVLEITNCVRIDFNLNLKEYQVEFIKLPSPKYFFNQFDEPLQQIRKLLNNRSSNDELEMEYLSKLEWLKV